ncbi:MAG: hypothetical protein DDT21_02459 [Syntrophomonadaceae bacterium]|nr:hypothetical protein [Bacillota bacterium]
MEKNDKDRNRYFEDDNAYNERKRCEAEKKVLEEKQKIEFREKQIPEIINLLQEFSRIAPTRGTFRSEMVLKRGWFGTRNYVPGSEKFMDLFHWSLYNQHSRTKEGRCCQWRSKVDPFGHLNFDPQKMNRLFYDIDIGSSHHLLRA